MTYVPPIIIQLERDIFKDRAIALFKNLGEYNENPNDTHTFWIGSNRFDFMPVDTEWVTVYIEKYDAEGNRHAHVVYDVGRRYEIEPFIAWLSEFI